MNALFEELNLGAYRLKNRILMAPMTRGRAGELGIPNELMAEYYRQRASAGLIIAEATAINEQGRGWVNSPGIYTDEQQQGWKLVADAVHQLQGKIFIQLWHMGRVVLPDFIDGQQPLAPSAIAATGSIYSPTGVSKELVEPRALTQQEIFETVNDFRLAARRSIDAGLDGVEIHAANGFLIDQFIRSSSNQRNDEYGGNYKKRARFLFEVTQAIISEIGSNKVGIRISPTNNSWGIEDEKPIETFSWIVEQLNEMNLAYLHVLEPCENIDHPMSTALKPLLNNIRDKYKGTLIANAGYDRQSGNNAINHNKVDAIAFGLPFIANPDLVARYEQNHELTEPDINTFYTEGEMGYSDYSFI